MGSQQGLRARPLRLMTTALKCLQGVSVLTADIEATMLQLCCRYANSDHSGVKTCTAVQFLSGFGVELPLWLV